MMIRSRNISCLFAMLAALCLPAAGQFGMEEGGPASAPPASVRNNDNPIKLVRPTVDAKAQSVSIPAAFWNQKMTNWVEVAACGRPSDFLHETIIATMTTKTLMEQAMRQAGFRDADAWAKTVREFPRIRGDRILITLSVTRNDKPGHPVEHYSLDELLTFQGWGVSAGPYGWMFKGDPERGNAANAPAEDDKNIEDRTKILRDDPQISLVFKGIRHSSNSYAEHPLAYDDWIYPMMRYHRNYKVLPAEVYDSNGEFPVTMTLTKCTEEEFLTQSAKLWHDPAYAKYMLEQLPIAKQIDKDKADLWNLLAEDKKLKAAPAETQDVVKQTEVAANIGILMAKIEKGYATLDAAWAKWAAEHPEYESTNNDELADLKLQTKRWREHMEQNQTRAEQLAIAEETKWELKKLGPETEANAKQLKQLAGKLLEAQSRSILAQDAQPREYWKWEQSRLTPDDPRKSWVAAINGEVERLDARNESSTTGLAYGRALQSASPAQVASAEKLHLAAFKRMMLADLNLKLINISFEIEKREAFPDDTDLPALRQQKKEIEKLLKNVNTTDNAGG